MYSHLKALVHNRNEQCSLEELKGRVRGGEASHGEHDRWRRWQVDCNIKFNVKAQRSGISEDQGSFTQMSISRFLWVRYEDIWRPTPSLAC